MEAGWLQGRQSHDLLECHEDTGERVPAHRTFSANVTLASTYLSISVINFS